MNDDSAPPSDEDPIEDSIAGRLIAGRYLLRASIGQGAHGDVWEAHDALSGTVVAVKLLLPGRDFGPARVRREIGALRLLRIPGVVQLLDEGVDGDRIFLVMELAAGLPFPGAPAPRSWPEIAETTTALLETLARVHTAGVLHRDIKPANVLVDAAGRPTILDFGLSRLESPLADGPTRAGDLLGTPAYIAPELINAEPATARVDLYAVGVMLYQALSGRLPHEGATIRAILRAKLIQSAVPLREFVPEIPPAVAAVVDRLLSRNPTDRPRSANEVLGLLRGDRVAHAGRLPWLGPRAPIEAIVAAALAGRPIEVRGAPGSGRSRCLEEVFEVLTGRGRRVAFAVPAGPPFASLWPIVGALDDHASRNLREVSAIVEERVGAALADGAILVVDDVQQMDRQSVGALESGRIEGCVIRSSVDRAASEAANAGESVTLALLEEAAIRPLFAGPDRLLHLQEDGARALFTRTGGRPSRIADEVAAWVRAGLARWDGGRLAIDREVLDGLDAGLYLPGPTGVDLTPAPLPARLDDLLAWVVLAWPHASLDLLARARREPIWRVEAEIEELVARGAARVGDDDRIEPMRTARIDESWTWSRRRAAHQSLAASLPPGHPTRLLHLVASDEETSSAHSGELAREARTLGERLAEQGHIGRAAAVLAEGLRAARRGQGELLTEIEAILALWVEIALADATPRALDRVLYEICRAEPREGVIAHLEQLVRAALSVWTWTPRALTMIEDVAPFAGEGLERRRRGVCVAAARRSSREHEEAVIADAEAWAARSGSRDARAALAGWLGRLRYRQGRFDEAAALQEEAAAGERWATARISAQLNGASALMEAFRHDDAAVLARAALELAHRIRHAAYEARAEWILRCVAYRTHAARAPDLELVDAVARIGAPELEPLVGLNEAAVAWRAGELTTALRLSQHALQLWARAGEALGSLLAGALRVACGDDRERAQIITQAHACATPRVALQALGLVAFASPLDPESRRVVIALAAAIPSHRWETRMEILSTREVLEMQGAAPLAEA